MRYSLTSGEEFNGVVLYRGPSALDGQPIVVIATGLSVASANAKTGAMIQVYILADQGERPTDAVKSGADASVCGDCPHRGGACYVNVGQGPNAVYAALLAGRYPPMDWSVTDDIFGGRLVRIGAYGDPAAVPPSVLRRIHRAARATTAYTHAWRYCDLAHRHWCMASCDSVADLQAARAAGWKAFRVRRADEPLLAGEFSCPASAEAGKRLTCETCLACRGGEWNGRTASPSIVVHGAKARRFALASV